MPSKRRSRDAVAGMSSMIREIHSFEEVELGPRPTQDRLPAMLFLAALIHGILILGITFNPSLYDSFSDAISLEVTILANPDQQIDNPDDADYVAQASQQGGGNTAEPVRSSAPIENTSRIDSVGHADGDSLIDTRVHERTADQRVSTESASDRRVQNDPRSEPRDSEQRAIALEAGAERSLPLPMDDGVILRIRDDEPRQLVISADTRESVIATYLDAWKRRIEAVGEQYFPELGNLRDLEGSPTLEVRIEASGQLSEVIIRKSSGSPVLDQAALDILRRAAPFEAFPPEIRAEYDRLRFAYKWLFHEQIVSGSASIDVGDNP